MTASFQYSYNRLSNKFYGDDTKKTFENRSYTKSWRPDTSVFQSSIHEQYKYDQENPIYLALKAEEELVKKAKSFVRTTPQETFADNLYDEPVSPIQRRGGW